MSAELLQRQRQERTRRPGVTPLDSLRLRRAAELVVEVARRHTGTPAVAHKLLAARELITDCETAIAGEVGS